MENSGDASPISVTVNLRYNLKCVYYEEVLMQYEILSIQSLVFTISLTYNST